MCHHGAFGFGFVGEKILNKIGVKKNIVVRDFRQHDEN
jgi:hypothetical protein